MCRIIRPARGGEITLTLFDECEGSPVPIPAYYRFKKPTRSAYAMSQALSKLVASKMQAGMEIGRLRVAIVFVTQGWSSTLYRRG
jgi:hypothetical protein